MPRTTGEIFWVQSRNCEMCGLSLIYIILHYDNQAAMYIVNYLFFQRGQTIWRWTLISVDICDSQSLCMLLLSFNRQIGDIFTKDS